METFASLVASRSSHAPMVHVACFGKAERASPSREVSRNGRSSPTVRSRIVFCFIVFESLEYD